MTQKNNYSKSLKVSSVNDFERQDQINSIKETLKECYFLPKRSWPKEERIKRSCERWSIEELLVRIEECDKQPLEVSMEFIEELSRLEEFNKKEAVWFTYARECIDDLAIFLSKPSI